MEKPSQFPQFVNNRPETILEKQRKESDCTVRENYGNRGNTSFQDVEAGTNYPSFKMV